MINKIFIFLFLIGLTTSIITNNTNIVIQKMLEAPKSAFYIFLEIYVLLIFWSGILEIIKDNGLLDKLSKIIIKIIHPLFPSLDKDSLALKYISMNFLANMLSMSYAATPFGLNAMKELQSLSKKKDVATNEMITFLVINTSSVCLIPTTILALRLQFNSKNSMSVMPYIIIISCILTTLSIILDKGMRKYAKY